MLAWGVAYFVVLAVHAEAVGVSFPENFRGGSSATRIVSGWEAEEAQIPFQLSLRMVSNVGGVSACGGSIIHSEWGLTAAHCTALRVTVIIRTGAVSLTKPVDIFETTDYYNHPAYIDSLQSVVQPNDIALLRFNRVILFNDRVQPIRLQRDVDKNRNYAGQQLVASGWGRNFEGVAPENLNWVYQIGATNDHCLSAFGGSSIIQDSTICTRYYNVSSQSTCSGDSGGPLTATDLDDGITQVGVTSFVSSSGCHTDYPAGFIRPGHYHEWYRQVTGINFDWEPKESSEEQSSEQVSSEQQESEESKSSSSSTSSSEQEQSEEPAESSEAQESAESEAASSEQQESAEQESEEQAASQETQESEESAAASSEQQESAEQGSEEQAESEESVAVPSEESIALQMASQEKIVSPENWADEGDSEIIFSSKFRKAAA